MFNDVFNGVTKYFDRRALIGTFLPSLFFWTPVTLIIFGWKQVATIFASTTTAQTVLVLVVFLAVVALLSVLVRSFQPILLRVYEGKFSIIRILFQWRESYWRTRRDRLQEQVDILQELEPALSTLYHDLELLSQKATVEVPDANAQERDGVKKLLRALAAYPYRSRRNRLKWWVKRIYTPVGVDPSFTKEQLERAEQLVKDVQEWQHNDVPKARKEKDKKDPWKRWRTPLNKSHIRIGHMADAARNNRIQGLRDLQQYYPLPSSKDLLPTSSVMPTKLGNVLKAAETYALTRYNIDATVIWPHLLSVAPKETAEELRDAKDGVDSMITISTYAVMLSIIFSSWVTWGVIDHTKSFNDIINVALLFIILLGFPLFLSLFLLKQIGIFPAFSVLYLLAVITILSLFTGGSLIGYFISIFTHISTEKANKIGLNFTEHVVSLIGFSSSSIFFSITIFYETAVQRALVYGEKVKALIDINRWSVFLMFRLCEGTRMQPPTAKGAGQNREGCECAPS